MTIRWHREPLECRRCLRCRRRSSSNDAGQKAYSQLHGRSLYLGECVDGPKGIRVHAISPGPLATRAASGIPEFDALLEKAKAKAPARSLVSIEDVGVATAFLCMNGAKLITGETLYIDGGYHIID